VAGLPDAGRPRPGVLLKALSSNGYETGRVRHKALHSKPEQGISGHMPLPSLDIAGSTIRGMQQPAELDTAPGASAPAAGQEAALPRGTVKRGPPGRSSSITWGDLPKVAPGERDNLPGVSGTAVRSFSRSNSSEGERVGERRWDSGDSSAAHAQVGLPPTMRGDRDPGGCADIAHAGAPHNPPPSPLPSLHEQLKRFFYSIGIHVTGNHISTSA